MGFSLNFKNIGHFFATGFKYVAIGIEDVIKVANKAQPLEPEVAVLAEILAGPIGAKVTDLAFRALGDIAAAITPLGTDAQNQVAAQGLNLNLDAQTILDILAAAAQIEAIFKSLGAQKPTIPGAASLVKK
jgi:hypothetical protein